MAYLKEREILLKNQETELLKIMYEKKGAMKLLRDVQARLDEVRKAIKEIEHEEV